QTQGSEKLVVECVCDFCLGLFHILKRLFGLLLGLGEFLLLLCELCVDVGATLIHFGIAWSYFGDLCSLMLSKGNQPGGLGFTCEVLAMTEQFLLEFKLGFRHENRFF